ncbi:MAG: YbdD/YjiX family protein [Hyphomicrobium sp.]
MRSGPTLFVARIANGIVRTARLMVGVPDYDAYVAHRKAMHPTEPLMTFEEFFRERQSSRYGANGGKISRCC